jgi:hypothetical protein
VTGAPVLAARARKARRRGPCVLCPAPVITGQPIGLLPAGWAHTDCIVRANRAALPPEIGEPA